MQVGVWLWRCDRKQSAEYQYRVEYDEDELCWACFLTEYNRRGDHLRYFVPAAADHQSERSSVQFFQELQEVGQERRWRTIW